MIHAIEEDTYGSNAMRMKKNMDTEGLTGLAENVFGEKDKIIQNLKAGKAIFGL